VMVKVNKMKVSNIKVAVRLRPLLGDELKQGHSTSKIQADENRKRIVYFFNFFTY